MAPGTQPLHSGRTRIRQLLVAKKERRKLAMLTAYDAIVAPLFEAAGVDMLLVGDSMGNVALGYDSTIPVSLEDIERATSAVARSTRRVLIVADLPFGSYEASESEGFKAAVRLLKAGAQAVKVEGGTHRAPLVKFLVDNGIPVMGHLGYTPQSEHTLGGPRVQGRGTAGERLVADARELEEAGAFSIVLEMVPASLANAISDRLEILTIGIGAGPQCDGQVLVWSDMAGMTDWSPSFARRFAEIGNELQQAAVKYVEETRARSFPSAENYQTE